MGNASLQLEQLGKTYRDGTQALHDVSAHIEQSEIITVVGPSGCGKSTLLRLIAGLDMPSTGRVCYNGRDITPIPAERRGMGVVFQNYALFPHLTVAENVGFGLRVRGVGRGERDRIVEGILRQLQLSALAHRRPNQLSGGQQQRVALGRALAITPAVLLLDEPLTALDAQLRETLRADLRRTLDQFGITTIYVTHDQSEALSLGDRVIVLHSGRVAQIGAPRTIYQQPASPVVAQFMGISNQIPATLRQAGAMVQAHISLGDKQITIPIAPITLPDGAPIMLIIRPEDLQLCDTGGHLCGTIMQVQFVGDRLRVYVAVPGLVREVIADVEPYMTLTLGAPLHLNIMRALPLYREES